MSNLKCNKLVLTKRSATFLPDNPQIRRDFGTALKKPKLDIRLTQTGSFSNSFDTVITNDYTDKGSKKSGVDKSWVQRATSDNNATSAVSASDASVDDLWGEELSEEAVEECLLLASQVCPEINSIAPATSNKHGNSIAQEHGVASTSASFSGVHFKIPAQVSKPSVCQSNVRSKQTSGSVDHASSIFVNDHTSNRLHSVPETGNVKGKIHNLYGKTHETQPLSEEIEKLQLENKSLRDKTLSKEGEVSILRQQLKQMQLQLEAQRIENVNKLEGQAQKYKEQLNEHKRELEITNTQLQFKIMEATSMRNHCKLLESNAKLKLIEPQRCITNDANRMKADCFSESILPSDISPPKLNPSTSKSRVQTPSSVRKSQLQCQASPSPNSKSCVLLKSIESKWISGTREGSVLGEAVNEFLFRKSLPEVSWILYIRKKQSLCRRIKEAEDINSTILSLQLNDRTLENCYTAMNKLIAMDSLSSPIASPYIEKVIQECQEIVCRQMHILHLLLQVQSKTERVLLSEEIASSIGTLAVKTDGRLMYAGQWYDDEEGVESRRALGLLSVLCSISHLASSLVAGTNNLVTKSKMEHSSPARDIGKQELLVSDSLEQENKSERKKEGLKPNPYAFKGTDHKPPIIFMETDSSCQDTISSENSTKSSKFSDMKQFKADYTEYAKKSFGFLHLLRDLTSSISIQRRTRQFIGLLTSIMEILKTVVSRSLIIEDGLKLMSEIIQEIVFACPQVEVVLALFELLNALAPYTDIMSSLCCNCESGALVDKRYINLTYFSRDSCVAQVLFRLLPKCDMSIALRTKLCSNLVGWLYRIVCIPQTETTWLLPLQEDTRTCNCKQMLTQGLVTTLYYSVCDFELTLPNDRMLEWDLRHTLVTGIMLLRSLLQREFGLYFESAEKEYQLLISKLEKVMDKLELNSLQKECLSDLLKIEERNEEKLEVHESCSSYWDVCASQCKSLLSKQAPSNHYHGRKPKQSIAQINKVWNVGMQ